MKHIFIIHSHITLLVAKKVINYYNFESCNVFFLTMRSYKVNDKNYKTYSLNEYPIGGRWFWKNRKYYEALSKETSFITNDEYKIYLPHTHHSSFVHLIYNKNCISYSYIEEGLACYLTKNFSSGASNYLKLIKTFIRLGSWNYAEYLHNRSWFNVLHRKFANAYCLSNRAFPELKSRIILPIDLKSQKIKKNEAILAFDALSLFGIVTQTEIFKLLELVIIPKLKITNYNIIRFKFHPMHYKNEKGKFEAELIRNKLKQLLSEKIIEIGEEFILEDYFSKVDCDVYTFYSSIGIYASIFGNNSFSVSDRIDIILNRKKQFNLQLDNFTQI